jgi:hypothetical protein
VPQRIIRIAGLVTALCAAAAPALFGAPQVSQFTPFSNDPHNILEGNWQSCREPDGQYGERVYDHVTGPGGVFELHMGPRREFALFKGVQDAHRDHDSPENLLKPYRVVMEAGRAKHRWEIPSMNLSLTATLAGGSRTDCESWFIVLAPLEKTSH